MSVVFVYLFNCFVFDHKRNCKKLDKAMPSASNNDSDTSLNDSRDAESFQKRVLMEPVNDSFIASNEYKSNFLSAKIFSSQPNFILTDKLRLARYQPNFLYQPPF